MGDDLRGFVQILRVDPARTAILVDFDGTLSQIVEDPAAAVPFPGVGDALHALRDAYGVVGVVSGRPAAFLRAHLPAGLTLVGLYGLEAVERGEIVAHPDAELWRGVIESVAAAADRELPAAVGVERKGLSLTLHVRQSPEHAAIVKDWAARAAASSGLEVRGARMSAELHPPVPTDKGTVVRQLTRGLGAACFIGDDVGDLPAFDALDELAVAGGAAVRLVVESAELDAGLRARADALLAGPPAVLDLLHALAP